MKDEDSQTKREEHPPILKRWSNVYLLVIAALLVQIVLYYFFTEHFE